MKNRILAGTCAGFALLALAAGPAVAGPGDAAVPSISASATTRAMFIVPGVIKNNGIETAFMCTSLDSADATMAVEIFSPDTNAVMNNVATGTLNGTMPLPAGHTVTISTGSSVGLHEDLAITGLVNVKNGSARILATTTRLVCTAILVEKTGSTPGTIATLKVFSRRKQNGD